MNRIIILGSVLMLAACGSNGNSSGSRPSNSSFDVTVQNLTVGQPLSPVAIVAHANDARLFGVGEAASPALEVLAEGGDNSDVLAAESVEFGVSGAGAIGPGQSETLSIDVSDLDLDDLELTVVSMLVNTNDAFTAANAISLAGMEVGDTVSLRTVSYDSGTEANTESAATIPGPAGGGEGFNATRDDIRNQITMHSGVVTGADGLTGSDLGQQHRWDNPVSNITITRTQ